MSDHQTARRRTTVSSAVVLAVVLVVVAVGYPDWLWFPLTISFWVAVAALVVSGMLGIRRRFAHS